MDRMERDPAKADRLILVDGLDREIGSATKAEAHRRGLLHRAFSVVLVREGEKGTEILLTRRAAGKYHSAGLWANACCSHPRRGETVAEAARRRLPEELGCGAEALEEIGSFVYRAEFGDGLAEYEYDHVLLGRIAGEPKPDPEETSDIAWLTADELAQALAETPERFCAWAFTVFSLALRKIEDDKTE